MDVGRAIRSCRIRRGVSQAEVAQRARCSVSYLSMLENNKRDPTLSTLTRIANALDVPIGLLFVLASEPEDLFPVDAELDGVLAKLALVSLNERAALTNMEGHHG